MMETKLAKLFKEIGLEDLTYFKNASVEKIIVYNEKSQIDIILNTDTNLLVEVYYKVLDKLKTYFKTIKVVKLFIIPQKVNDSLLKSYYLKAIEDIAISHDKYKIFLDRDITLEDGIIKIKTYNKIEYASFNKIKEGLLDYMTRYGYHIDICNTLSTNGDIELQKQINEEKNMTVETKSITKKPQNIKQKPIYRKKKDLEIVPIKDVLYEVDNINIQGKVFNIDYFESKNGYKIFTLKVTDYTDSIYVKIFTRDDNEAILLKELLKENHFYLFSGRAILDKYANEIVLNTKYRDIKEVEPLKDIELVDEEPLKRVELHAHTMMSQMDGVTKVDLNKHTCELVTKAIEMGYSGVAITDHNGCQALPIAYEIISKHNKNLPDGEKHFKGLYGVELTLVDDTIDIVTRPTDLLLNETTFVIFDTETTGFNAGGIDQIIEIGAVKMKGDKVISQFDELIDPQRHIPDAITAITSISDEMVQGKDDEKTVTKRFLEWVGDAPLVAHNAKFDISFIEMAIKKYHLNELKNTIIDTLELSRALDQGYARHSLSALVKRYNIPWQEDEHHRADYDALGTGRVFAKMIKKLNSQNIYKICELDKLVSKEDIYKFGRTYHFNAIAKNKKGLKNLFKIISLASTTYLYKTPRILRSKLQELREGLLIGSGCYESEVFIESRSKEGEELTNIINFYDYVEVQPPEVYSHLIETNEFKDTEELNSHLKKIIMATKDAGKIIVASGDVHHFKKEDKIYREIIVNQKVPGGGRHPLAKNGITQIPSQHFRTTKEMLNDFNFLSKDLAFEIVVTNTNKILDMVDEIAVIIDTGGIPFSPRIKADDGISYLDCPRVVTDLVYAKASSWYGDPLPYNVEERIAKELYGDIVYKCLKETIQKEDPTLKEEELQSEIFKNLHSIILEGFEAVKTLVGNYLVKNLKKGSKLSDEELKKEIKKQLGGIIGGGFDPIYLIAQRLVKHSNDEGYLVGSRGSVGSSFVATLMGITEVNPLPAHYRCLKCQKSFFKDQEGQEYSKKYSSGFDLPDLKCPNCQEFMYKDGQDMPFATFLGFNADKVPDIDLNFSDLNQASAHEYTKVLFGIDNVYRAGTIGTVADKTAFGYVKGYFEDRGITNKRRCEIERLAIGCTGVKRTTGQHPGGIVVVPDYMDVFDFTPYQYPADDITSQWRTTHFDYHAIDQDLLKLDILGHSDPTQLRMIQDLTHTDILKIPMDDKETMSIFTSTKALGVTSDKIQCSIGTLGIPEFGTPFTIGMAEETKPTTFAELVKISGLSHGTDVWLGNAHDLIKNNIVPFKDVIGCRDDIMIYLVYHKVKPLDAFKIMEFVRKGKASKEPEMWQKYVEIMKESHIDSWFIDSCYKIKYMFPKAHAVAYVISAFRIAWYKVHMPCYFYASWFTTKATDFDIETMILGNEAIKRALLQIENKGFDITNKEAGVLECLKLALEATARGIKIANIDLYQSESNNFKVLDEKTILPPFKTIDGLGDIAAKKIEIEAKKHPFISIEDFQNRCKVSSTLIEKMKVMGIFQGLPETSQLTLF